LLLLVLLLLLVGGCRRAGFFGEVVVVVMRVAVVGVEEGRKMRASDGEHPRCRLHLGRSRNLKRSPSILTLASAYHFDQV
jgi:hypothetical protein